MSSEPQSQASQADSAQQAGVSAPAISLPKGGGAIRGLGEKFAANPVTGTGSLSVPIAVSPGRSGFGPQLALSYDSGSGNGPFGFGWSLSVPAITRKTEKGLPRYLDAAESDVFVLSGVEDLVPAFQQNPDDTLALDAQGRPRLDEEEVEGHRVRRYRPRLEGLLARIERWTRLADGDVHWRSLSRDNILTIYGLDAQARIADPANPARVFSWLISETRDDRGNAVVYEYKPEDGAGAPLAQAHQRNRGSAADPRRAANRYLKRIRYGNQAPLLGAAARRPFFLSAAQRQAAIWLFELVFDYGEHHPQTPLPQPQALPGGALRPWAYRADAFSTYRAGFEVRTSRLCQRVLLFHHFADQLPEVGADCLVRSTDFRYSSPGDPSYTFLTAVTQTSYQRDGAGGYRAASLPPLEFEYSPAQVQDTLEEAPAAALENLPQGIDGAAYQWTDLHGEGIPGILSEQGGGWFYRRNLSPLAGQGPEFGPLEPVALKPNLSLAAGAQFLDLAGDGLPDLVQLNGPLPGLFEHDAAEGWQPFRPFSARLNRDFRDPNLKLIDLDGDGQADVLISEQEVFTWHAALGEAGFEAGQRVPQAADAQQGPRLVFAAEGESIFLADFSGDGLTDLARIRNGEACYWPNLGYGRFGAQVNMDDAPWFDQPDQFDPKRLRVADIDGSGTVDLIYLHREGVRLYFNQSGNAWGAPQVLRVSPPVDSLANLQIADLLGNGTACLVWSSPLPADGGRPLRYVNLMGSQKPHLLLASRNNLGAETRVQYAPSTKFYLQDRAAGTPWVTRLPFPVHVVERVTLTDQWRGTTFSSTYSYHHGYFDGEEREFRGFGRVDQVDCETYGTFAGQNAASPYITPDQTLYQPPVKTVTWYHTGAALERERVLTQFAHEYFPNGPAGAHLAGGFQENLLPEPDLAAQNLTDAEWREALRACKGLPLRQEVYELEEAALQRGEQRALKLFTCAYHNCHIRLLQARAANRHAVFLVTESEQITYHYEQSLTPGAPAPDPRIAHSLTLSTDKFGNALQAAAVVYPRVGQFADPTLTPAQLAQVQQVQRELHLAYTENRYTLDENDAGNYRLRQPCEILTYELTGFLTEDAGDRQTPDPRDNRYFTLDELRRYRLSPLHQQAGLAVQELAYQDQPDRLTPQKRLVEHVRLLFFADDLQTPLPLGQMGRLGLPYETYRLAQTDSLLAAVLGGRLSPNVQAGLDSPALSGYLNSAALAQRFGAANQPGQYWLRSGIAGYNADAPQHFYLPERYTDAFGSATLLEYDPRDLYIATSTDPTGSVTRVLRFDYRVLAACELQDINENRSEVTFDVLGLPVAAAVKGKGAQADDLTGLTPALLNPTRAQLLPFFDSADLDEAQARGWLQRASSRYVYYFGDTLDAQGRVAWAAHPPCVCGISRELHAAQDPNSPLQVAFEYSDGLGSLITKKVQAEPEQPGQPLRWLAPGKVILNNKGKPVKQYEPYFSRPADGHLYEEPAQVGVTAVLIYDALGRLIRTDAPDGSFSRVEFSPWHSAGFDAADTAYDPILAQCSDWYRRRMDPAHPRFAEFNRPENTRAAQSVQDFANTPTLRLFDSQGREVVGVTHNRVRTPAGALLDEKYFTFTRLDAESKPLWLRDARGNLAMQYILPAAPSDQPADPAGNFVPGYDIAGNLLYHCSADAGERWSLSDAAGKPLFAWNSRGFFFRYAYDALHRLTGSFVTGADLAQPLRELQFEKIVYGDDPAAGLSAAESVRLNLRGKPYRHFDGAGVMTSLGQNPDTGQNEAFDFKGNLLRSTRQLAADYKSVPDWLQNPAVEPQPFVAGTTFDALNRPLSITSPDGSVYRPTYNPGSLLESVAVNLRGAAAATPFVRNIDYDAKGRRARIDYNEAGHSIRSEYSYDPENFRLSRLQSARPLHPDPQQRRLQDLSYTYDPLGNLTHIEDQAQPRVFFDNDCIAASADYQYDALYRLLAASGREQFGPDLPLSWDDRPRQGSPIPGSCADLRRYVQTYRYDPVGNLLQMVHHGGGTLAAPGPVAWNTRHQYLPHNNQLRGASLPGELPLPDYSAAPAQYGQRFAYDLHGNMAAMPHLPQLRWDFHDQLQASAQQVVAQAGATPETTYYVYNAAGQRVRKVTERQAPPGQPATRKEERIYLGGLEIYRAYDAAGAAPTLERETLHVMDDQRRIALVETRTLGNDPAPQTLTRYVLSNHLGSATLELDDNAETIAYEEYYPYGSSAYQARRSQLETPPRYRYTGKERDEENALYYHGARYYAPWLGRWTACDPAGLKAGINFYVFTSCNPIRYIDPSGMADFEVYTPTFRGQAGVEKADALIQDVFKNGIAPKGGASAPQTMENLLQSINVGSEGSGFVQSSQSVDVAMGFATGSGTRGGVVFEILNRSDSIIVSDSPIAAANTYPDQKIVAHPGGVKPEQVVRAYKIAKGAKDVVDVIENPNSALAAPKEAPPAAAAVPAETPATPVAPEPTAAPAPAAEPAAAPAAAAEPAAAPAAAETAAAETAATESAAASTVSKVGLGTKVLRGVGVVGGLVGSLVGGVQVGTGFNQAVVEGQTGEGSITMGEGGANLAMTIGTAALVKAKVVTVTAGGAAGAAAVGATALATGSIMLAAEESRRALRGEKTMAVEATEYYADLTVEGEQQGGVKGALKQAAGWTGGFFSTLVAVGQGN